MSQFRVATPPATREAVYGQAAIEIEAEDRAAKVYPVVVGTAVVYPPALTDDPVVSDPAVAEPFFYQLAQPRLGLPFPYHIP